MTDPGPMPEPTNADLLAFLQSAFTHLATELSVVKADVGSLGGRVDEVAANLEGVREELRGEIRALEARVTSRLTSLQQVTQSLKADVARHDDGHPHAA